MVLFSGIIQQNVLDIKKAVLLKYRSTSKQYSVLILSNGKEIFLRTIYLYGFLADGSMVLTGRASGRELWNRQYCHESKALRTPQTSTLIRLILIHNHLTTFPAGIMTFNAKSVEIYLIFAFFFYNHLAGQEKSSIAHHDFSIIRDNWRHFYIYIYIYILS